MLIRRLLIWLGIAATAFAVLLLITGNAIAALVLEGVVTALIWLPHRLHGNGNPPPGTTRRQRIGNWWTALRLTIGDIRRQWYRLLDRIQHRRGTNNAPPAPVSAAPRPPAPRRPPGAPSSGGGAPLAPVPVDVTPAEIPPAFTPLLAHVSGFEADEDADLMAFTRGLAAGDLALADALQAQLDHCVTELGLDPVSVQGFADYADDKAEHAQGAMQIWQRFAAVYAEVQNFVSSGGVLPKDGRFLTGEG